MRISLSKEPARMSLWEQSLALSRWQRFVLGASIIFISVSSVLISGLLSFVFIILILLFAFVLIRNSTASLFALIFANLILALRTLHSKTNGAPSTIDLLFGLDFGVIIAYWLI